MVGQGMADPTAEGWDEFQSMLEGCDDDFEWERDDKEDCDDEGQDAQRGDPTPDDDCSTACRKWTGCTQNHQ